MFSRSVVIRGIDVLRSHYRELATTMDVAVAAASLGEHWVCITADFQASGRGTHGRAWTSPPGTSLMMSLVLPPPAEMSGLESLTVKTAEILRDVLRNHVPVEYSIKQPNDLMVNRKKCAGILYESITCGGVMSSLVLGMGVNLTQSQEDFTAAGLTEATSLMIAGGDTPGCEILLRDFLDAFIVYYLSREEPANPMLYPRP